MSLYWTYIICVPVGSKEVRLSTVRIYREAVNGLLLNANYQRVVLGDCKNCCFVVN